MASEKLNIRVSSETYERLTRDAAEQGVTLSAYSAALIERSLGVTPAVSASDPQGGAESIDDEIPAGEVSALAALVERLEAVVAAGASAGADPQEVSALPKPGGDQAVAGPDPAAFMIEMLMLMRSMALSPSTPDLNVRVAETIRQQLGARRRWGY